MSVLNPLTRRVALDARQKSEALLQCSLVVSPARALFVEFVQQSRMPTQFLGDQLLVCICFSFSRLDCSSGFSCCRLSVLPRVFTLQHSGHGERAGRPSAWRTMARVGWFLFGTRSIGVGLGPVYPPKWVRFPPKLVFCMYSHLFD